MIQCMLILIVFSYGGLFCLVKTKKGFLEGSLYGVLVLIPILYFCAIVDMIPLGRLASLFVVFVVFFYSIYKLIVMDVETRNKTIKENMLSIIQFFLLFLFIYNLSYYLKPIEVDEFRVWASYPKILFFEETLPQFGDFPFTNYPPALQLLQYLMLSFGKKFNEGVLFVTQNFLQSLLILQVFLENNSNKRKDTMFFELIITFIFPFFFFSYGEYDIVGPYFTLYADLLMGIIFGYGVCFVYQCKNNFIDLLKLCLLLFFLALLKPSSVPLSMVVAGLYALNNINELVKQKGILFVKDFSRRIFPFLVIFIAYISWFFVQNNRGLEVIATGNIQAKSLLDVSLFIRIIRSLCLDSFVSRIVPAIPFLVLCLAYLYLLLAKGTKERKMCLGYYLKLLIFFSLYVFFLYISYIVIFSSYEAEVLASFVRYINSYLSGLGLFILFITINCRSKETSIFSGNNKALKLLSGSFLIITLIFVPFSELSERIVSRSNKENEKKSMSYFSGTVEQSTAYIDLISLFAEENTWVYFYIEYSPANMWVRDFTYYQLIENSIYLNFYPGYFDENIDVESFDIKYMKSDLQHTEYMLIASDLSESQEEILFKIFGQHVESGTLYKIKIENEVFSLEKLGAVSYSGRIK